MSNGLVDCPTNCTSWFHVTLKSINTVSVSIYSTEHTRFVSRACREAVSRSACEMITGRRDETRSEVFCFRVLGDNTFSVVKAVNLSSLARYITRVWFKGGARKEKAKLRHRISTELRGKHVYSPRVLAW